MKKYLFRFLLKDKIYLEKMISNAEKEIADLKGQISKKDNQIEFLQTLIIKQNKSGSEGEVPMSSNLSPSTQTTGQPQPQQPQTTQPQTTTTATTSCKPLRYSCRQ